MLTFITRIQWTDDDDKTPRSLQKIYGLLGPEHHRVDLSGDVTMLDKKQGQRREYRALSQWTDVGRLSEQYRGTFVIVFIQLY